MSIREVRIYGDPVLRQPALEVREFDARLRQLAADLRRGAAWLATGALLPQAGRTR